MDRQAGVSGRRRNETQYNPGKMVATIDKSKIEIDEDAGAFLDERAAAAVEEIANWVRSHAAEYGVDLIGIRLRHWQSIEDPRSHDLVVDLTVVGDADHALEFRGAASEALGQFVMRNPSPPAELLCMDIHWR